MIDKYKPKYRIEFLEMIDRMYERKVSSSNCMVKSKFLMYDEYLRI